MAERQPPAFQKWQVLAAELEAAEQAQKAALETLQKAKRSTAKVRRALKSASPSKSRRRLICAAGDGLDSHAGAGAADYQR